MGHATSLVVPEKPTEALTGQLRADFCSGENNKNALKCLQIPANMKPRKPASQEPQGEMFRTELAHLIDPAHPLARLAGVVDWQGFEEAFSPLYDEGTGRDCDPVDGGAALPQAICTN